MRFIRCYCLTGFVLGIVFCLAAPAFASSTDDSNAEADSTMKLRGGEQGTIFKSLRIEGEDRVRIEFDRPSLDLALDPRTAPGLDFEIIHSALGRNVLDLVPPYLARSAVQRPPRFAWPWVDRFVSGSVARFRPALEGVERWQLSVANSRGETVARFEGKGKPPKEIVWDGRAIDGEPAPPGLTYSYVLEAYDRAGNKRNFVGDGFEIPPYIVRDSRGFAILFAGKEIYRTTSSSSGGTQAPPILLEAASWINQSVAAGHVVQIRVTARTFEDAKRSADSIVGHLRPLVLGDPNRLQPITNVEPDAPDAGTVMIAVAME